MDYIYKVGPRDFKAGNFSLLEPLAFPPTLSKSLEFVCFALIDIDINCFLSTWATENRGFQIRKGGSGLEIY